MKYLFYLLLLILASCGKINVHDVTLKIQTNDRGNRQWHLCVDYEKEAWGSSPISYFEVHAKDGEIKKYEHSFIHIDPNVCRDFHPNRFFHNMQLEESEKQEQQWLKELDADDIEYILFLVKMDSKDQDYVYQRKIESKELK